MQQEMAQEHAPRLRRRRLLRGLFAVLLGRRASTRPALMSKPSPPINPSCFAHLRRRLLDCTPLTRLATTHDEDRRLRPGTRATALARDLDPSTSFRGSASWASVSISLDREGPEPGDKFSTVELAREGSCRPERAT